MPPRGTLHVRLIARCPLALVLCALTTLRAQSTQPSPLHVAVSPKTVVFGYYSAQAPPVLRVKSGDVVTIETVVTAGDPAQLEAAGARHADIPQAVWDIYDQVKD